MAIGRTHYADVPASPDFIRDRLTLERTLPYLAYAIPAQKKPMPTKNSKTIYFSRYPSLPKGVELAPGTNPEPYKMSRESVSGTLKWYGAYVQIDEEVDLTSQDPILSEAAELLGENAGETFNEVYGDAFQATSSILCAGTDNDEVGEVAAGDVATAANLIALLLTLRNANAKPFLELIRPSDNVSTQGIGAAYLGITTYTAASNLITVVNAVTNGSLRFVPVAQYPSPVALENEVGAIVGNLASIRIICSTEAKTYTGAGTGSIDVQSMLVFGQDAVAVSELSGHALRNIVKSADEIGGPLEMYATSGWKGAQCGIILDDNRMINYLFALV